MNIDKQQPLERTRIVDSREPWERTSKLIETGWERKMLASGDAFFLTHDYRKVGITIKGTTTDLLNSINEVWSKQLEDMLDYYDINIILIEGSWQMIRPGAVFGFKGRSYVTWDMLWDYLRRFFDKGFSLELTIDTEHTIQRLNHIYALYQKPYSMSGRSKKFTDDRILALPPGTRGKTGQKVLEGRSLREISIMSVEELLEIDGIGAKKAELIANHFSRKNEIGDV